MKPPVIARQLDRCEVCGREIHRHELVRTQVDFLNVESENLFAYSSYNTNFWTIGVSALTDMGTISIGPYADEARCRVEEDDSVTEINGSQTWDGDGTIRSTTAVDCSSYSTICFSVEVGPYQQSSDTSLVVAIGICDANGNNKDQQDSWTLSGQRRCWFSMNVSDIASPLSSSSVYFYMTVVSEDYWWADDYQLESDKTSPGFFRKTLGSAVSYSTDTALTTVRKVCERHYEPILKRSTRIGRPRGEEEPPIKIRIQEF